MPNEKTSIPCAVCRDLAPLVADGVASAESEALVRAHLEVCPACAAEWPELCAEGERPDHADVPETVPLPDDIRVLRRLHRKLNRRSALLLTAGALGGALLTYSNRFNLIILFFPLVCGVFSWQRNPAWRVLPVLTFLCTAGMALVLDAWQHSYTNIWAAVRGGLWMGVISAALCLIGALAGRLFAYAFKKEEDE
ncbi:MAG TPA: zf-HC2 domain-containing protein [Candidatus Gemmiger avicola]|uniref:Zf-HC2 domain-containing protein n=1 Tax=Candidatus Gemmiger avicola TaxID=2838605 RepID=A0A9D2S2T8_9FIRM|nr:zf-HC2 domain-containing protein [Candidatus Gemmiger avicola]